MTKQLAIYIADPSYLDRLPSLIELLGTGGSLPGLQGSQADAFDKALAVMAPRINRGELKLGHLYFGQEFCGLRIPARDEIQQAARMADRLGLELVYVSGPTLERFMQAQLDALAEVAAVNASAEVVVNDLGVLAGMSRWPDLRPLLGRLQVKIKRLPRFARHRPVPRSPVEGVDPRTIMEHQTGYFRKLPLLLNALSKLPRGDRIRRAELDLTPQGVSLASTTDLRLSAYLPWSVVTWGHACTTDQVHRGRFTCFPVTTCARPCKDFDLLPDYGSGAWPLVQRGNAVFMSTAQRLEYALQEPGFDRIVFEPFLPL